MEIPVAQAGAEPSGSVLDGVKCLAKTVTDLSQ
jgi:hypothetical protein